MTELAADYGPTLATARSIEARDASMDSLRIVSFLAVATLHVVTSPTKDITPFAIIDHLTRFAVPVFFMMSGYFFERPGADEISRIFPRARRLLVMFGFWEVVYNGINLFVLRTADYPTTSIKLVYDLLYYSSGPAYHLWFLPHLVVAVVIFTVLRRFGFGVLLTLAAAAYLAGLVLGPWSVLAGPDTAPIGIGTRNGLFFGFPYFALGAYIRYARIDVRMRYLLPALLIGIMMQLTEAYAISRLGTSRFFAPQDFLLGTLFFSVAVFLTFKRLNLSHPLAAQLGRLSPGIFCAHIIFFNLFTTPASPFFIDNRYIETGDYAVALLVLVLTVASSTAAIVLMAQSRSLQQVVR